MQQPAITNAQCEKPYFKRADVDDFARRIILQSVHKADLLYCTEDEMAKSIRIDLNNNLGGHWHVIVGRHFASYFTFTPGLMAHLKLRDLQFLVYKYEQGKFG
ncbi:unnamed protein product [Hymenolepis diminuta]|uniref:Dynein light chain n=1 Tax=Hymenolepis diminuta TaxID=6216 RepID=A0A0R3SA91_HYMDI|nr:unnamed protein product [Hymenolepis diminuta]VUZ51501.1 unnamed protein product [Hymenolepis diminuta]